MFSYLLPTELVLKILSDLRLRDIFSVYLVSRNWNAFILANEDSVYRQIAISYRFVLPGTTLGSAQSDGPWTYDLKNWKDLCHRHCTLQKNWDGEGLICAGAMYSPGDRVTTFALDEEQGTVIACGLRGGLTVTALATDRLLWSLPRDYVGLNALCQSSCGFLTFVRYNPPSIEVWRRSSDIEAATLPVPVSPEAAPLESQLEMGRIARASWDVPAVPQPGGTSDKAPTQKTPDPHLRGHYTPHCLLRNPDPHHPGFRSYHSFYPLLAASSRHEANLYDLRSGRLLKTFDINLEERSRLGVANTEILALRLSKRHLCVCTYRSLVVIAIEETPSQIIDSPSGRMLFLLIAHEPLRDFGFMSVIVREKDDSDSVMATQATDTAGLIPGIRSESTILMHGPNTMKPIHLKPRVRLNGLITNPTSVFHTHYVPEFSGGRFCFSPDGHHLAAVSYEGVLFLITDFAQDEHTETTYKERTAIIDFEAIVYGIVWGEPGIIISTGLGIFVLKFGDYIVTPVSCERSTLGPDILPNVTINNILPHWSITQMRVTKTGIWFLIDACALEALVEGREDNNSYEEDSDGGIGERDMVNVGFIEFSVGLP